MTDNIIEFTQNIDKDNETYLLPFAKNTFRIKLAYNIKDFIHHEFCATRLHNILTSNGLLRSTLYLFIINSFHKNIYPNTKVTPISSVGIFFKIYLDFLFF